jgi:RecA/RadA recombinase
VLASGLRRLAPAIRRSGAAALFLNHTRGRRDGVGEESETAAGGPPLKLFAALRLAMGRSGGNAMVLRVLKNRASAAFVECRLSLASGGGFAESP